MTREVQVNVPAIDQFPAFEDDGFTKRSGLIAGDFTTTVFKDSVIQALTVTITEVGSTGEYKTSFTPVSEGFYEVQILIDFNKEIRFRDYDVVTELTNAVAIEARDIILDIEATVDQTAIDVTGVLGLLHQNSMIDNYTFDANDQLLSARLRVFADAGSVPPTAGGSETSILEFAITATYSAPNRPSKYTLTKVP